MAKCILTDRQSMGLLMPIDTIFFGEDEEVSIRRVNLDIGNSVGLETTGLIASCFDQWTFARMTRDEQMSYIKSNGFGSVRLEAFATLPDDLSNVILYIADSTEIPDDGIIKCWKISGKGVE